MSNLVHIFYKYEEDMASTKTLLMALVDGEEGNMKDTVWTKEPGQPEIHRMTAQFPTSWKACWFIAKLTGHLDFISEVSVNFTGNLYRD